MITSTSFNSVKFPTVSEKDLSQITGSRKAMALTNAALAGAVAGAGIGSAIPVVGSAFGAMLGAKWGMALYGFARYGI